MSDKPTNDDKDDDYLVSAYIKMKVAHFCGYCKKTYKMSGLYLNITTCSKNYEMTDEQRTACKKCQNNSSKTYNQKPDIKLKNYRALL